MQVQHTHLPIDLATATVLIKAAITVDSLIHSLLLLPMILTMIATTPATTITTSTSAPDSLKPNTTTTKVLLLLIAAAATTSTTTSAHASPKIDATTSTDPDSLFVATTIVITAQDSLIAQQCLPLLRYNTYLCSGHAHCSRFIQDYCNSIEKEEEEEKEGEKGT